MKNNNIKCPAVLLACIISFLCEFSAYGFFNRFNDPIYTIDGISYMLNVEARPNSWHQYRWTGAVVVPNTDETATYSGTVKVPEKVIIDGTEYPVYGFDKLTENTENISNDLVIELPNSLKVIGLEDDPTPPIMNIKSFNIPYGVEYVDGLAYRKPGTLVIPGSVKKIGYQAFVYADELALEDGVGQCSAYSLGCSNTVLTVPGTIKLGAGSLSADKLRHLIIKKSANKDVSPEFNDGFCDSSYEIMAITCEYERPPKAHKDAFRLESSNFDPLFPGTPAKTCVRKIQ